MKKHLLPGTIALAKRLTFAFAIILISNLPNQLYAQCGLSSFNEGGTLTPTTSWQNVSVGSGTYVDFNIATNNFYSFRYTSSTSNLGASYLWDMTLSNTSTPLAYNNSLTPVRDSWTGGEGCPNSTQPTSAEWFSTTGGTVRVNTKTVFGSCQDWISGQTSATLQYKTCAPASDPGSGSNSWNVEAFATTDISIPNTNARYGYYNDNSLNFVTASKWSAVTNPSNAAGWVGCGAGGAGLLMPNDNFAIRARRTGFPCDLYKIYINKADDNIRVYVNGTQIANATCCISSATQIGNLAGYVLKSTDVVEIRLVDVCGSGQADVSFVPTAVSTLTEATIGSTQSYCGTTTPSSLSGLAATGGYGPSLSGGSYTYDWYYLDNCVLPVTDVNSNTLSINPPSLSNTRCYVRTVTDACNNNATSNTVTISIGTAATANPGVVTESVCQSSTPYALSSASVGGGASTGAWTITSGGGTLSSTAQTATPATVTFTPTTVGTTVLTLTTNDPTGACPAVSATRTVTVFAAPTASSGAATETVCQSSTPYALSGATIGGGASTGAWSITSGTGTLSTTGQTATPTTVTFTPTTAGTVVLTLTTDDPTGPCGSIAATRTVTVNAAAVATAGGPETVCQSVTPYALSGASISGGASTGAWSITSGTGTLSSTAQTATPATVTFTPTTIGTVVLTLTTDDPAGICGVVASTRTITVNPVPTVEAGGPDVVCQSTTAYALTGSSFGGGATSAAWSITSGTGTLSTTAQTGNPAAVTFTPTTSGTVTLTLTSDDPAGNCYAVTDTRTITINSLPTPTISVVEGSGNASNDGTTCSGDNVTLTANPSGLVTYSWDNSLGLGQVQSVNPSSTTTYVVTVTDGNTCSATASTVITVNPLPVAAVTITEISGTTINDATICNGDNATLTASPNSMLSYVWDNALPSQQTNVVTPSATTSYSVTVTNTNNCSAVAGATVNVNSLPSPTISVTETSGVSNDDGITCYGDNVTLTANPSGLSNYSWNNALGTGDTKSANPTTTTTYVVTVTDANNCSSTASTAITVNQLPVFSPAASTDVICNGGNTGTITVNASTLNNPLTYSIDNGTTYQASSFFNGLIIGNYTLIVKDNAACSASYFSNPVVISEPTALTHSSVLEDASCANVFDGKITITASGSVPPYVYSLNGGPSQSGNVFSGLAAGSYNVLVTDDHGCTSGSTVVINNSYIVSVSIVSQTDASCYGAIDGSVTVDITGGTPPYSYSINGVQFVASPTFSNLAAGNYVVTLRDSKGCTDFLNVIIGQPALLQGVLDSVKNISCNGGATGAVYISVTGGTPNYSFVWSNAATSEDITGLVAGTYNVAILDAHGCSASLGVTLTEPLPLFLSIASYHDLKCFNDSSGNVDITVGGGVPPYTYAWSNGAVTEDISGLKANTYSLTLTDNNGCQQTVSQVISEPTILAASAVVTNLTCNGSGDGAIDLTVTGGTSPYGYLWSNGNTGQDLSLIAAGTYTAVITDAHGCVTSNTSTVTQPNPLVLTTVVTNVLCTGNSTAAIDLSVIGGTGAYTYAWTPGGGATQDTSNLVAGTYTVLVTDANACAASTSATVTQPSQPLSGSVTATDVTCNGASNGTVNLALTGGTQPYTYAWDNSATTEDLSGLGPNTYNVTATDANGCTYIGGATVNEPAALVATIAETNVSCFGGNDGEADLTVTGGNPGYTYLWSTFAGTEDLTGLTAGNYVVIVNDTKGCQAITSVTITQPAQLAITGVVTNILCNSGTTGSIDITVTGGTGAYTYAWTGGGATEDTSGLVAGTYTVLVTDANNCTATATYTITQPSALTLSGVVTDVTCNGYSNGAVNITVGGGATPYTYAWTGNIATEDLNGISGGTYDVTVTDINACSVTASFTVNEPAGITSSVVGTNVTCNGASNGAADLTVSGGTPGYTFLWSTFQNTEDLSNIGGGTYYVIIKDANGCEKRDSVVITEPAALVLSTTVTNVLCNGAATGAIDLSVTGGTGTYTYAWTGGGATQDTSGLVAGTYSVTVTDANNCSATTSATITQPAGLVLNATTTNVGCAGGANGSIDITVQGGVFPYGFSWTGGATTEDINGLSGGTYSVTITDANACSITASYTITEPIGMTSSVVGTNVTCNGASNGAADLTVSGGTPGYTFLWSTFQNTEDLVNIGGGTYYVIITDANGCEKRDSVVITEPAALVLSTTVTNVLCNGAATGAIDLSVTGGTGTYTYAWTGGGATQDTSGLVAGTYSVTVTDANNCSATTSATITQPAGLVLNATTTNVGCAGGANGSIDITVQGGVFPYGFSWTGGATTEDINGLSGGTYSVTITDANACSITASYTITEPTAITSSIVGTNVLCNGAATGAATLTVGGGTPAYSFLWSNFNSTQNLTGLTAGTYFVIIKDANGCEKRDSIVITQPAAIVLTTVVTDVLCGGDATGGIDLSVTGGNGVYDYTWSNVANTQDLTGVVAGTYCVTVKDGNNCTATVCATITEPAVLAISGTVTNVQCFDGSDGQVNTTVVGGTLPYTFAWTGGAVTEDIQNLAVGTYDVTVTDAHACSVTASYTITSPTVITSSIVGTDVTCNNVNNGSANLTVGGGVSPYTFFWSNFLISEDISGLDGGTYYVIITDANGCTHRDSVIIDEPSQLVLTTNVTQISCFNVNDGAIDVTVAGGTQPYTYAWNLLASTSPNISGLAGGTYVVTVTDNLACTASIATLIINPSNISTNVVINNPNCFGDSNGSIDLIATGGSPNYTFLWNTGDATEDLANIDSGVYSIIITDDHGCQRFDTFTVVEPSALFTSGFISNVSCFDLNNGFVDITAYGGSLPYTYTWSTQQSTEDIGGLDGGTYFVTVTDAHGCSVVSLYIVAEPAQLTLDITGTDATCFGSSNGTLTSLPGGGSRPYEYLWDDFNTDSLRTGVPAGCYSLLLTDSNGCHLVDSICISEPTEIAITGIVNNANCFNAATGGVDISVTGGTPGYTYFWTNGSTFQDLVVVSAGPYTVSVTDANACEKTADFTITQPQEINLTLLTNKPTCSGASNGSVSVVAIQGITPYTYSWNTTPAQTTATASDLFAGSYTVTVTDANGCTSAATETLVGPTPIVVTTVATGSKCFNSSTGIVATTVTGGLPPYVFQLNGATQDSSTFYGLAPGHYVILVTDANSCMGTSSFDIASPGQIDVDLTATEQLILTGMYTQLIATATSTTPIIGYMWSPDSLMDYSICGDPANCPNPYAAPRISTIFTVTVMNADSCTASDTITIYVSNELSAFIPSAFTPNGDGLNDRFEFDILGATNLDVSIYNRWGERVFVDGAQPNGITGTNGWDGNVDGKYAPDDTYVWKLTVTYFDGVKRDYTNTVTIMR